MAPARAISEEILILSVETVAHIDHGSRPSLDGRARGLFDIVRRVVLRGPTAVTRSSYFGSNATEACSVPAFVRLQSTFNPGDRQSRVWTSSLMGIGAGLIGFSTTRFFRVIYASVMGAARLNNIDMVFVDRNGCLVRTVACPAKPIDDPTPFVGFFSISAISLSAEVGSYPFVFEIQEIIVLRTGKHLLQ